MNSIIVFKTVSLGFQIYNYLMIMYILSSWFPSIREHKITRSIGNLIEPYFSFFRRFIPPIGMLDLSPVVAIVVFNLIETIALTGLSTLLS